MTAQTLLVFIAGATLMALVWWPMASGGPSTLLVSSVVLARQRSLQAGPAAAVLAVGMGFTVGLILFGAATGMAVMVLTGVCAWAVAVRIRSRRGLREAEELAQLTNGLANQALVAPTVVEAIRQAAPLIPGRVGGAARQMAAECETGGLVEAANRFSTTIRRPIAEMLATVLAEAFRGGSQWVGLASVLADEATEAAETARHFHRHVAALMPQIVVTVVMAVGMLAITGFAAKDVGRWLISPVGQQLLLLLAVLTAAVCARVLTPAWRMSDDPVGRNLWSGRSRRSCAHFTQDQWYDRHSSRGDGVVSQPDLDRKLDSDRRRRGCRRAGWAGRDGMGRWTGSGGGGCNLAAVVGAVGDSGACRRGLPERTRPEDAGVDEEAAAPDLGRPAHQRRRGQRRLTVSGRAFTVAQGAIGAALDAGKDPLPAVTAAIAGSPAEPLLASVTAAERAGAASSDLLDKSLSRSVRTLESERRLAIDQLSRAIGTTVTLVAAIAGLVVMAAVVFVL